MKTIIVITWKENDGLVPTGELVMRDGCYRPVLTVVPKARAVVWSRDMADEAKARAFCKENAGMHMRLLADTDVVLDAARQLELIDKSK